MSDRELLEMAAKAAGISIWKHGKTSGAFINNRAECWSPMENGGDALRLALKLGICVQPIPECDTVQIYQIHPLTGEPFNIHVAANGDIEACRSIVQAAAEIGRQTIN